MNHSRLLFILLNLIVCLVIAGAQQPIPQPHLSKQGTATQLIVDNRPFLVLGGELGNSSSSSVEYMKPIWSRLTALNLNTALVPVYWELVEPVEGQFDFALVDGLIREARVHKLRLVPLWFASWKNSMSCYAPEWVKADQKRFPRSQDKAGNGMEILSPFAKANVEADARAFAAFMRHLREVDGNDHTVVMVQVDKEIGMIPDSRDRSAAANELWNGQVPSELMSYLQQRKEELIPEFHSFWAANGFKSKGTWQEVFGSGPQSEEVFMAWHFARYTNQVTAAGKKEYSLPMFVNAALIRPGYQPGQYPSAGPLPHLIDVWRAGAPQIDFLAPDIYFQNFAEWTKRYQRRGNPLFVPEAMAVPLASVNALYAIGQHDAIGFSPFSIDSLDEETSKAVTASYQILTQLSPLILEKQGRAMMSGLLPEGAEQRLPQQLKLGGYVLNVTYERSASTSGNVLSGGLVISTASNEFIFAGTNLTITFETDSTTDPIVGLLSVDEGKFVDGHWQTLRRLNGDQTHQGRHVRLPGGRFGIQRVRLYRYH